jgi:hypothetical protein
MRPSWDSAGAEPTTHRSAAQVKGEIDVDQITLMGTFGRRWTDHLEFLFGLAYVDLSMDLSVQSTSGGPLDVAASRDADWIDPTLGLRYERPIGDDWRVVLRGDIGGFGVGSDFMYHLLAGAGWQASDAVDLFLGYRLISYDYEEGQQPELSAFRPDRAGPDARSGHLVLRRPVDANRRHRHD